MPSKHDSALRDHLGVPIRFVEVGLRGRNINVGIVGEGAPVVLIHGINIGWGQWYPNVAELAKKHTVYLLDLPGAGSSYFIAYSEADLIQDFVQPVEQVLSLLGLDAPAVVGHSFGAWIVCMVAARGRVRLGTAVIVSPLGFSLSVPPSFYPVTLSPIVSLLSRTVLRPNKENLNVIVRSMLSPGAVLDDSFLDYYANSIASHGVTAHPFWFINRLCAPLRMRDELFLGFQLAHLPKRTLVILGAQDPLLNVAVVEHDARVVGRASTIVYPQVGHVPALETPVQFNKDVIDFLRS